MSKEMGHPDPSPEALAGAEPAGARFGMRFPAISLWQPYASLPLFDLKPWETRKRPYPAKYDGQRVIVASTKAFAPSVPEPLEGLCANHPALLAACTRGLPRGQALYTIVLKGCERTEDGIRKVPPELLCTGDFSPGRWMWEWGDVEPFNPFPVKGGQGWWFCHVPDGAFRCATVTKDVTGDLRSAAQPCPGMPSNPLEDQ